MKAVTVRFPEEVFEDIQKEAYKIGSSVNSYLMVLLHHGRKVINAGVITVSPDLCPNPAMSGLDVPDHTDQARLQEESRTCYSQSDAHVLQRRADAHGVQIRSELYRKF